MCAQTTGTATRGNRARRLPPGFLLTVATTVLATGLAATFLGLPGDEPDSGGAATGAADLRRADRVELARVPGSVVSAAAVAVPPGLSRLATEGFSMVAVTWRGEAPGLQVSTRSDRAWGRWQDLEPLGHGPDGATDPATRGTELVWVGPSDGVRTRISGSPRDVRVVLIDPGVAGTDDRGGAVASRAATVSRSGTRDRTQARPTTTVPRPRIRTRKRWDADESWRNSPPRYIRTIKQVHVHHTVNSNDYRRRDVPGILRGIYRYHTHNLGWSDIGYNFLVDRFGRAWVGRKGGAARRVRGAHTLGFNHRSTGVAVIGNFEETRPPRRVLRILGRLSAWKLDMDDRNPRGWTRVTSQGSDKFPDGERVRLRVIDGHRDTNDTACPGQRLYDKLRAIRRRAARRIDRFT